MKYKFFVLLLATNKSLKNLNLGPTLLLVPLEFSYFDLRKKKVSLENRQRFHLQLLMFLSVGKIHSQIIRFNLAGPDCSPANAQERMIASQTFILASQSLWFF